MPWVRVWLHCVWSTKNRHPYLNDEIRYRIFEHIRENAAAKNIYIELINGYVDHVHCLLSLGTDQTIENIMKLLKGESSFWINRNKLTKAKFEWQEEYFIASVSDSNLTAVRKYIANQEIHHQKVSFGDEFDSFLSRAGFGKYKD